MRVQPDSDDGIVVHMSQQDARLLILDIVGAARGKRLANFLFHLQTALAPTKREEVSP